MHTQLQRTTRGLVALGLAGTLWLACRNGDSVRPAKLGEVLQPGAAAGFNVLLITLDTTRPDHLGCYGYEQAQTPTIDSLLTCGVRFDDAVTSVPTTLASHATLLTGLYPPTTGVRDNGHYSLAPGFVTLAEVLKGAGYDTAAFVSSFVLDRRFGLAQGFDVYDFEVARDGQRGPASLEHERRAHDVTSSAIGWLRARGDSGSARPFFAWVHYFDPHHPYDSPLASTGAYGNNPYDAEIAFVDLHVKRLLGLITEQGLRERTLVVLVSDHGEGLSEHGEDLHGIFVYESALRVALILSNPRLFSAGYRVDDRVVGTVDVLPTVLELLGLPAPALCDGQSLLLRDTPERAIYIETVYPLNMGCSALRGLRRHGDKYIEAPRPEYYDLRSDPAELANIYEGGGAQVEALCDQLRALVDERWSENEASSLAQRQLSPQERTRLEALGYVLSQGRAEASTLPDPKDRIHLVERMREVTRLLALGQLEAGLALAREVADQAAGWRMPTLMMAEALQRLGRNDERADVLARFCAQSPSAEVLFYLAHAQFELKRFEECERTLAAAAELDPRFGSVPALRGDVYFAQQRYGDAAAEYEQALATDGQRLGVEVRAKLAEARRLARQFPP
ncbi:MAG: sulfatase-like hydrolase/transferase [Planctomycetes bacterium]|nr:sulfatase-like hydrolase/transferase [Planctomycetota bacterium]